MPKYLITWSAGYGEQHEIVDAFTLEIAKNEAKSAWYDEIAQSEDHDAVPLTTELCYQHGYDPREYGLEPDPDLED